MPFNEDPVAPVQSPYKEFDPGSYELQSVVSILGHVRHGHRVLLCTLLKSLYRIFVLWPFQIILTVAHIIILVLHQDRSFQKSTVLIQTSKY